MSDVPPVPPESRGPSGPLPQGVSATGTGPSGFAGPAGTAGPAGREPDVFGRLLRSIGGRDWLAASLAGVGAWVAAYVVAGIALLLTVGLVAVGGSGDASFGGASLPDDGLRATTGTPDVQSLLSGLSVLLGAPAQLVALADFGRLHVSGSVALFGVSGAASVGLVPALVLLAQVLLAVVLTRRIRSRALGLPQVLVTSALTGLVLTACTTVAGLALAIRFPASSGVAINAVHAVGVGSIVGAFAVGALSTLLARPALLTSGRVLVARALGTARVAALHVGTLTVLVAVALVLVALTNQPSWGAALPIVVGNLALALVALGFLGGIGSSGLGGGAQSASVFGGTTGWIWLVVLAVLVTAVLAGLLLAVRRNDRVRATLDWVVTPAVWLVLGFVVFVLGTAVVSYSATGSSTVGGSGSVGITPWTPVVFALWGAAIEAVARYLAPVLLPLVGGRLVLLGSKVIGADPRPVVAPTWSSASVDGPAAGQVGGQPPAGWVGAKPSVGTGDAQPPVGAHQPFVGQGAASTAPMSPHARKVLVRSLVAGGVVVVVVVAGAVTAGVLRSSVWGPAPTVRSYVDAIARGDATAAARMSEVPGDASMLDTAVLKSARDRPADVRVGRVRTSGDTATATVSYTQDGRNRSGSVELRRTGTSWLVHDEWRVTTPLATRVSVGASSVLEGAPVTIAGKRVGKIENGSFASLAYPGTYRVQVGGSKYFVGGTKTVSAGSAASSAYVDFEPEATEQLTTDAEQWVQDLITTCAAKTDVDALDGCPWYGPYDAEGPVTYAVKTMPELAVEASGSGTVQVTSTSDGVIGYDYTSFFGDSGHAEDTFDVSEYLKVQDGKLVSAF